MDGARVNVGRRRLLEPFPTNDAWALTTYDACSMRCTYCITETQGISRPRLPARRLRVRLPDELAELTPDAKICVGPFTDAYPDVEADERVTRAALEVLNAQGRPFNVVTKGVLAARDIELFRQPGTCIQVSVCTTDSDFVARHEPGGAPPVDRIALANHLAASGVATILQCAPWIPGVSDVAAIRAAVLENVTVQVTPLRLPARLTRALRAFEFDQRTINAAYRAAFAVDRDLAGVRWSRPPPLDGAAPHITDNFGSRSPTTWEPAGPSPRYAEMDRDEWNAALVRAILESGASSGEPDDEPTGCGSAAP